MIYLIAGHSMSYMAKIVDKALGDGMYQIVRSDTKPNKKVASYFVNGAQVYKQKQADLSKNAIVFVFDTPFFIDMPVSDVKCLDMDVVDFASLYNPKSIEMPTVDMGQNEIHVLTKTRSTLKAIDFFTTSSVIDKVMHFVYTCSSNRSRPAIKSAIFQYVIGAVSKDVTYAYFRSNLRKSTFEKGEAILQSIFDWIETDEGQLLQSVFNKCKKLNQEQTKDMCVKYGVDKFDIITMQLNSKT